MAKIRKLSVFHIGIYIVIFFLVWSIRELIIRPVFLDSLNEIMFQVMESSMKLLVWTLPAVLFIRYFQGEMWISLKEMFTNKPKWFKDAPMLALVIIIPFLQAWMSFGKITIHQDFVPIKLIETVLFVGITEEMVFRGFLLNAMLKKMKLMPAILINAALFLFIHYPFWIYQGHNISMFISSSFTVLLLGALFAYSFVKTKNILIPIALHMKWNLLLAIFYG